MMVSLIAAFLLSYLLVSWFISAKSPLKLLDRPNERSLHESPIPKTGGIALLIAMFAGWLLLLSTFVVPMMFVPVFFAALLVAGISFVDDLVELSPLLRIAVHALAAAILVYSGFSIHDSLAGQLFTFISIIWMLNLYNFMDGMDGFAGGMTLSGFGFIGLAGFIQGDYFFALLSWTVAAASAGFLIKNYPPAQIFMGDAGSATLGFLAAAFSLWGIRSEVFDLWFPLLVFSPFILDATITVIRRALKGKKIWQAHREHYYQRLALAGWGHKKTVVIEYMLMLAAGSCAVIMLYFEGMVILGLGFWAMAYLLIAYKADQFCNRT
jgi:UDP-N-acetylmuramyl pentapeptide phosphotransferase/UDP-N-acetylglucosamine-1-phosphate transferase